MSSGVEKKRVCVIGAGPSGMSTLYHFGQMTSDTRPDIVCYEKQEDWGGLWNFSWRTGTDKYGGLAPWSMYHALWSNGPKEALEFPDYTFEKHFGRAIPSFPPRLVLRDYLEGRWKSCKTDLRSFIKFNTAVKHVAYNTGTRDFSVWRTDLSSNTDMEEERFDYVVVTVGIFNTPNVPSFPGLDQFPGRILHSHDFRDANEFQGKRLLIVGASYSAEDLALQCNKFGSGNIICTWRTKPMGFKWPQGIEERPLFQRMEGNTAIFKDGSSAEVDTVILCTGYLYNFPFLAGELRLKSRLSLYPDGLYKGSVFVEGGDNRLLYLGVLDQYYTFTMFDAHGLWACKYISGQIKLPSRDEMLADVAKWRQKVGVLKDCHDDIDFQTEFVADLCEATCYSGEVTKCDKLFHAWEDHKDEDILTYRDRAFSSIFTGTMSPLHHTPFMKAFDDSLEAFVYQTPDKASC